MHIEANYPEVLIESLVCFDLQVKISYGELVVQLTDVQVGFCTMGNSRKYPYPTTDSFHASPCLQKLKNALPPPPPPCPQNSIIMTTPTPLQNFYFFWKYNVHFRLSNGYVNKQTWIDASSRLWFSSARRQALLFSDKKNLLLCKLLFKSEFGYKNKHHLR